MPIGKLKHPVCKDVEYIDLKRNGVLLKTYGKEVEGKTWRQFQLMIGKEFGSGRYHYMYKANNADSVSKGQVNGVNVSKKESVEIVKSSDVDLIFVKESIQKINERLDTFKGDGLGIDVVLQVTRQNYEMQITFLTREVDKRDAVIIRCENKIDDLENELSNIDDPNSGGTIEAFKMVYELVSGRLKGVQSVSNLQDSDQSDIPSEILKLLGMVDWNSVQPEIKTMIIDTLGKYIQKLPMKGK